MTNNEIKPATSGAKNVSINMCRPPVDVTFQIFSLGMCGLNSKKKKKNTVGLVTMRRIYSTQHNKVPSKKMTR
jgi:hypothetical protein